MIFTIKKQGTDLLLYCSPSAFKFSLSRVKRLFIVSNRSAPLRPTVLLHDSATNNGGAIANIGSGTITISRSTLIKKLIDHSEAHAAIGYYDAIWNKK
jgi:hypothetical protein